MRTQVIKQFLLQHTHFDLASLYDYNMECQVNVAQDNGTRVEGDYEGHKWVGWTDGVTTWKPFRIPYNAKGESYYDDKPLRFDFDMHVEGIGMTGWDWLNKKSVYVAFDFDAITGHSLNHNKKLTKTELNEVIKTASDVEWVTVRKSTSGSGVHLYVFLDDVHTNTHTEHAAVARAILGKLSALTGFDFNSKVDNCGGNMWVWHRKQTNTDGLTLIKQGTVLEDVPVNWRDHLKVVRYKSKHATPDDFDSDFEKLAAHHIITPLDTEHKKLINFLSENAKVWWWDSDLHMLITHTKDIENAFNTLQLKGFFKTNSTGSSTHNCFLFPVRDGAWHVRRYTRGVQEHPSWEQDGDGWTRCVLNRELDFNTACRCFGGVELPKGGFQFDSISIAMEVANILGAKLIVNHNINAEYLGRKVTFKQHKDGRLIFEFNAEDNDTHEKMPGWLLEKNKWTKIIKINLPPPKELDIQHSDDVIRHIVVNDNNDAGWVVKVEDVWVFEPINHVKAALSSLGYTTTEITSMLGSAVLRHWKIVNEPFQPEYIGNRQWNRNGAQLRYAPLPAEEINLHYPTWMRILSHIGKGLTYAVQNSQWCKESSVCDGADYLKCWIASVLQYPKEPLPYLFLYGEENSGKSILHEALELLLTTGYMRAEASITSKGNFNGELERAILCCIEEIDLGKNQAANNKMKDWVTGRQLLIHQKNCTPFLIQNCTHWIHVANKASACPIFPGDTRITVCHVDTLKEEIPKRVLLTMLEKEAQHFITALLRLELHKSGSRLNIPVLETSDKATLARENTSALGLFIQDNCIKAPGNLIKFSEFYDRFTSTVDSIDLVEWTKIKVQREVSLLYPKGRSKIDNHVYIGNIAWNDTACDIGSSYVLENGYLIQEAENV